MKYKQISESGLIKRGAGSINGFIVATHSSGTLKLFDGTEAGVNASAKFVSAGACVPAYHAQNVLTSSGVMVAGTHPVSTLTGDAIVAGNIVVIGDKTYTFRAITPDAYDVLLGATLTATLINLKNAINGSGAGFNVSTPKNTQVVAVSSNATTVVVRGRVPGTSLNSVATTGTALRTVWNETTLGGGAGAGVTTGAATVTIGSTVYTVVDALSQTYEATAIAYQVVKGADEAAMIVNLRAAINGTGGANYSTGTVAHPDFVCSASDATTLTIRSRVVGTAAVTAVINALATTETMANTAWADTTCGGGTGNANPAVTSDAATITINTRVYTAVLELSETLLASAVADQILWVTTEAVFLDNVKLAINASGIAGTQYSTGTTENSDVVATTNSNTEQTVVSKNTGTASNSIAVATTLANYSLDGSATTLLSGTGTTGKVLLGTITFPAVTVGPLTYNFPEELSLLNGLYATIGGVVDITIQYN